MALTPERMHRKQRMASFDAGRFGDFYCQGCDAWTPHLPYTDDELEAIHDPGAVTPACSRCHEDYQCGECGFEIDQEGNCLRPEGHESSE